jgi:hypothetical protein
MKATRLAILIKNFMLTSAAALMIFSFEPCAAQANFLNSAIVPAARGSVKVTKDKYNNYVLKIDIANLAEAARLTPPKNTYVIWMVTAENAIKNIGQVRTTTSILSKKLNAYFETKSSFKPVKIFITAEYDPNIQEPGQLVVLTTANFDLPKK